MSFENIIPGAVGICLEISKSAIEKVVDVTVSRMTFCNCSICQLNDAFYQGSSMCIQLVDNADRIRVFVCPSGATSYSLKQTVNRLPEGTVLVANYQAAKHRTFMPNKFILAFKQDKTEENHVKIKFIDSKGLKPWTPIIVNKKQHDLWHQAPEKRE